MDANFTICDLAMQGLCELSQKASRAGAHGMTADQIVRVAIVRQMLNFTYKELAFHIIDSNNIRLFMRISAWWYRGFDQHPVRLYSSP